MGPCSMLVSAAASSRQLDSDSHTNGSGPAVPTAAAPEARHCPRAAADASGKEVSRTRGRERAQAARDRQTAQGERGKLWRGYGADSRRRTRLSARAAPTEAHQ
jgi:hypothetical protein